MSPQRKRFVRSLFVPLAGLLPFLVVMGSGCSSPPTAEVKPTYQRLKILSSAYLLATDELGHPPADRAELLPFVKSDMKPEEVFRSADDGQEFVIIWGVDCTVTPPPVTIYEAKGKSGTRQVVRVRDIHRLNDAEFKNAPFPPGHKAPL